MHKKQLIPQQRIDEAAKEYSLKVNGGYYNELYLNCDETLGEITESEFTAGVQFTLKEIEPLMVEFAEWCAKNYLHKANDPNGKEMWIDRDYYINYTTTQQLLEEFINSKNE